jgi:oligopeptide/dipeptide ABC transporter ATP-binding protein
MRLTIEDLRIHYDLGGMTVRAVDGISFEVPKGMRFGLIGESGSGKTTVVKSILKILPDNAKLMGGRILLNNKDIATATEKEMDSIRWTEVSLVTQSAMHALNPIARISNQMVETFMAHIRLSKKETLEKCKEIFEMVGLSRNRIFDYPHQFSGGMRQRVIIAMAIALDPGLIIADEPTTALDVIMQAQIVNLLRSLSEQRGLSLVIITHNIAIVAEICQTVGVMYAGRMMEYGDILKVFAHPHHPYTMGLQGAFPSINDLKKDLTSIPGHPPLLIEDMPRCGFSDRCPFAIEKCREQIPEEISIEKNHRVSCHRYQHAERFREKIKNIFANRAKGRGSS